MCNVLCYKEHTKKAADDMAESTAYIAKKQVRQLSKAEEKLLEGTFSLNKHLAGEVFKAGKKKILGLA